MQKISLFDRITLERLEAGAGVVLETSSPEVPRDRTNLACVAAELFYGAAGIAPGCRIGLEKRIPAGAGLGGGSSNAGIVLAGLNRLYGGVLPRETLLGLAARAGSDVAFFVDETAGTALCTGRGEVISEVWPTPPLHYVLVVPPLHVATREVYARMSKYDLTGSHPDIRIIQRAMKRNPLPLSDLGKALFNRLEQPVADFCPDVLAWRDRVGSLPGCVAARMSGSGSAVFGLVPDAETARGLAARLSGQRARVCEAVSSAGGCEQPAGRGSDEKEGA